MRPAGAQDAVAGHDDRDRVRAQRVPRGAPAARAARRDGHLGVGAGLAVGDPGRLAQHGARVAVGDERPVDRDLEVAPAALEVLLQLAPHLVQPRGRLQDARRHRRRQPLEQVVVRLVVVGQRHQAPPRDRGPQRPQGRVRPWRRPRPPAPRRSPGPPARARPARRRRPSRPRPPTAAPARSRRSRHHLSQTSQSLERAPAGRLLGAPHHRTRPRRTAGRSRSAARPPPAASGAARGRRPRAPGRPRSACRRGPAARDRRPARPAARAPARSRSPCVARWSGSSPAGCRRSPGAGTPAAPSGRSPGSSRRRRPGPPWRPGSGRRPRAARRGSGERGEAAPP